MKLEIVRLADDPALWETWDELDDLWPPFMWQDPTGSFYYRYLREHFPEHCLLAVDRSTGRAVAKANSVPLAHDFSPSEELPEGGWDWAIRQSVHDRLSGSVPTICSALEIMIRPTARGTGLSSVMLGAMRDNVTRLGFRDLIAPVRSAGPGRFASTPSGSGPTACRSTPGSGCTCAPVAGSSTWRTAAW